MEFYVENFKDCQTDALANAAADECSFANLPLFVQFEEPTNLFSNRQLIFVEYNFIIYLKSFSEFDQLMITSNDKNDQQITIKINEYLEKRDCVDSVIPVPVKLIFLNSSDYIRSRDFSISTESNISWSLSKIKINAGGCPLNMIREGSKCLCPVGQYRSIEQGLVCLNCDWNCTSCEGQYKCSSAKPLPYDDKKGKAL